MTIPSAAAARLFQALPSSPTTLLDIPIVVCPACEKRRPMTIKSITPHMRQRNGAEVEYSCAECGARERKTVKPA
jgi:hypothetical protein